ETLANHSIPPSKSLSFAKTSIVTGVFFAVVAVSLFTIILSLDSAATDICGHVEVFDSIPNVPTGKQSATRSRRVSMLLITLKLLFCLSCVALFIIGATTSHYI
ncbi:MAG: hypothetical protein WBH25_00495, partial [Coprothermobacter proteolyticus]